MIKLHYEEISIECDCCLEEEFVPDLEGDDKVEISLAWKQAECMGWRKLIENDEEYHYCSDCCLKHAHVLFPPASVK